MTELPVGEECWIYPAEPVKPVSCPLGLPTQPLELAARPADDIEIDPFQGWTQLRLVEVAVVVDPAANARVVHLGQVLQGLVAAMMKRPAPNCSADGRQRLRTGGGQEARKGPTFPPNAFLARNVNPRKSNDWFGKSPRRFASLQQTIFVFSGCSTSLQATKRSCNALHNARASSALLQ